MPAPTANSDASPSSPAPARKSPLKRILGISLKIIVACLGIWFVSRLVNWNDTATIPARTEIRHIIIINDTRVVVRRQFTLEAPIPASLPAGSAAAPVPPLATQLRRQVTVEFPDKPIDLNVELRDGWKRVSMIVGEHALVPGSHEELNLPRVLDLDVAMLATDKGQQVQEGLRTLLTHARKRWYFLLAAWAILVVPFLVSSIRWRALMQPQGMYLPLSKCLQLTFVGQFYSIMLPGITGGDLVKIVYTARLTGSKTKSIVTILLDRVIGLIALMVIAGVSASVLLLKNRHDGGSAHTDETLRNVVLLIVGILLCMALFALVYFSRRLRNLTGLQRLIDHSHMPDFIKHADEALHTYRSHFGLLGWAFAISIVSQLALPVSAWLSGMAFGVHMNVGYYLSYVPVAIIAVSLPSLPQGVGVLDGLIVHFLANRGMATASQAFAIAQAIRFLPILWNFVGAYWVFTGKFSRHQAIEEQKKLDVSTPS
jgi:uncharacterized protein (TIRG00374 family)